MSPRSRAALIHFLLSAGVASIAASVVFFVWYPSPLAKGFGLLKIFLILVSVDAIIGPFLTLLIYKKGKKSLQFDIAVIVALQVAAFAYGAWKIAEGRPSWLVFNMDRFDAVQAMDIDKRKLTSALPAFRSASWTGPKFVASRNPVDNTMRTELMFESGQGGPDLPQRVDLFVPINEEAEVIRKKAISLDKLGSFNKAGEISEALKKWPEADSWLPLSVRKISMTVLINKGAGAPVAVVDLRPWNDD